MKTIPVDRTDVQAHFTARAEKYDRSSHWCTDPVLLDRLVALAGAEPHHALLDVAVGTGLVSARFRERVGRIVGADINLAMAAQARPYVDEFVEAPGEALPFPDDTFDLVTCRQGIQFMDAPRAVAEMVRVTRPGGRILLVDLCAYGPEDRDEYFEVLRLRNPARRNFFVRGDVGDLLRGAGCRRVEVHEHVTVEDVDAWSDHGAIEEARREAIREVYRNASPAFRQVHSVEVAPGHIVDHMLFGISVGTA